MKNFFIVFCTLVFMATGFYAMGKLADRLFSPSTGARAPVAEKTTVTNNPQDIPLCKSENPGEPTKLRPYIQN